MSAPDRNLTFVREYLAAIERGAVGDALARFFTADVVQHEYPNRFVPHGARHDLAGILDSAVRGQRVLSAQHFEIEREMANGDHVALEVQWTGTLAVSFGPLPEGSRMRARFAVFLDFRDGKIAVQRNYDCFEPW